MIEESVVIHRPPAEVFAYSRSDRTTLRMASVAKSEWLNPTDADPYTPAGVGRRGRMVAKIPGRRLEFIDEVTEYEPGRRIAHRTVKADPAGHGMHLQPEDGGCRRSKGPRTVFPVV